MDLKENAMKAVTALVSSYEEPRKNQLFTEDSLYELTVCLTEETALPRLPRIVPLPVKHSVYPTECEICLITAPPQRHYKDLTAGIEHVRKVVDIIKLSKKYKELKQRKMLYQSFHLFLADRSRYKILPRLLGKQFMTRRTPVPMKVRTDETTESFAKKIKYFLRHTPVSLANRIRNLKFKVGRTNQTPEQVADNVVSAVLKILSLRYLPHHWKHVKSISIKLPDSPSLILYAQPIRTKIVIPTKSSLVSEAVVIGPKKDRKRKVPLSSAKQSKNDPVATVSESTEELKRGGKYRQVSRRKNHKGRGKGKGKRTENGRRRTKSSKKGRGKYKISK
jgi:ribosome biogenesis protein UTP30